MENLELFTRASYLQFLFAEFLCCLNDSMLSEEERNAKANEIMATIKDLQQIYFERLAS